MPIEVAKEYVVIVSMVDPQVNRAVATFEVFRDTNAAVAFRYCSDFNMPSRKEDCPPLVEAVIDAVAKMQLGTTYTIKAEVKEVPA